MLLLGFWGFGIFDVEDGAMALIRCAGGLTIEVRWPMRAWGDGRCARGEMVDACVVRVDEMVVVRWSGEAEFIGSWRLLSDGQYKQ